MVDDWKWQRLVAELATKLKGKTSSRPRVNTTIVSPAWIKGTTMKKGVYSNDRATRVVALGEVVRPKEKEGGAAGLAKMQ